MKRYRMSFKVIIALGLISVATLSSCKKALETTPYSSFTSANFFKDVDEAYMATLGVYEIMSSPETYGWYIPMVMDNDTDISQIAGDASDSWRLVPHSKAGANIDIFYTVWSNLYKGIDRANLVIEKIPEMTQFSNGSQADKDQLNRMLGEVKFLRGFYYAELIRLYGDVPFKQASSKTGDDLKLPLTDRDEIYKQIIKDMQEAITLLPDGLPVNERISKYGAKAMLARVALFAGGYSLRADGIMQRPNNYRTYYELAQIQINDVINSGLFKLNKDYAQVFINQCQHKFEFTENLFEVAFYNPSGLRGNGSWFGIFNGVTASRGVYPATTGRYWVTRTFYDSFTPGDLRRDFSIANYSLNATGGKTVLRDGIWTCRKWSREFQTGATEENAYTFINNVIMRYSDVLLMRAEVENELNNGPNQLANEAIAMVRSRAFGKDLYGTTIYLSITNAGSGYKTAPNITISGGGGTGATATATIASGRVTDITMTNYGSNYGSVPTVTISGGGGTGATAVAALSNPDLPTNLSKDAFFDVIVKERAQELAFEGMRRSDLIRWNILKKRIDETYQGLLAFYPPTARVTYYPYANFVSGKNELYPIPQNELDVNKNITRQNNGY